MALARSTAPSMSLSLSLSLSTQLAGCQCAAVRMNQVAPCGEKSSITECLSGLARRHRFCERNNGPLQGHHACINNPEPTTFGVRSGIFDASVATAASGVAPPRLPGFWFLFFSSFGEKACCVPSSIHSRITARTTVENCYFLMLFLIKV